MKITEIKEYISGSGNWNILIKDFNKRDFKIMIKTLKSIGFKRDDNKENLLPKVKRLKGDINQIKQVFTNKENLFDFTYLPELNLFAGVWESEELTGEEFMSMLFSN